VRKNKYLQQLLPNSIIKLENKRSPFQNGPTTPDKNVSDVKLVPQNHLHKHPSSALANEPFIKL
jgi:hypothetical protein